MNKKTQQTAKKPAAAKAAAPKKKPDLGAKFNEFRSKPAVKRLYDTGIVYHVIAFIIPVVLMLIGFRAEKIYPFGEQQFLVVDLWHQYYPFFRVVREKLTTGGSFLYSWQCGMGTNFLSLIAYYAMSPLNWIAVFFKEDSAREALMYILLAKIGFSSTFFNCFLRYTYKHKDFSTVIFSVMYALCSFTLGYYWNVMWFDTFALFPLVMLGVVAMCREGKWKLYTVTLALSLIFNYYIGFFTCIFTMFMFAAASIIECRGVKDFFYKFWLILRSSVIGLGLGAFILIPAYLGLQLAYKSPSKAAFAIEWNEDWRAFFANLMSYSEPTSKEGLANIACGMLAVTLFGVFLFSGGIKLKEKIMTCFTLAVITISLNMKLLNYIWHGFHFTNQLPYRFSFIFSFILLAMGYRAYDCMVKNGIKYYQLPLLAVGPGVVYLMEYLNLTRDEGTFTMDTAAKSSLYIVLAYVLIFVAVKLLPMKSKTAKRSLLNLGIAVAMICEMSKVTVIGVKQVGSSDRKTYPANNAGVQAMLDLKDELEQTPFARVENTKSYSLNDGALYGYTGVSQFSSSANVSMTKLYIKMGLYGAENGNRYYYRNATPIVNDLLGVNYVLSKNLDLNNSAGFLEKVGSENDVYLYRNKYPLSIGFMMDKGILNFDPDATSNPLDFQSELYRRAAGTSYSILTPQPVKMAAYDNLVIDKINYGYYQYALEDSSKDGKATYEFAGVDNAYLYGYARNGAFKAVTAKCDDEVADPSVSVESYPVVFPMGNGQAGSTMSLECDIRTEKSGGTYTLMAYALKMDAFEEAYNALADEQFRIDEFTDTRITGTVDALKDGVLYFSIPYEKGWSVYVDGRKTESVCVINAMLGVELDEGHHEIELRYCPEGFIPGLLISGGALALFALFAFLEYRRKKNPKQAPEAENAPENGEMEDIPEGEGAADLGETNEKPESNDSVPGD